MAGLFLGENDTSYDSLCYRRMGYYIARHGWHFSVDDHNVGLLATFDRTLSRGCDDGAVDIDYRCRSIRRRELRDFGARRDK
jgi:hypothetical protein